MECERCGDDVKMRRTLRNVKISGDLVSEIRSTMKVCNDCHDEMEDSDAYEW